MVHKFRLPLVLLAGILIFIILRITQPFGLSQEAASVLGVGLWMVFWWITEMIPMPVVALLPLILFPLLGITPLPDVAHAYANPVIFLFLGGFMIGLAIEKWNLHQRIAMNILQATGTSGNKIVLGFILATGFISMWLSNTATTMMMYPIAMSVIAVMEANHKGEGNLNHLSVSIMLAIAYASNLAGISTIIGTPPNVAYVGFLQQQHDYSFSFAEWMTLCIPLSIVLMGLLYLVTVYVLYPNRMQHNPETKQLIREKLKEIGKLTTPEKRVLIVFVVTAFLWITKDILNQLQSVVKLNDTMIALIGAVALFILPSGEKDGRRILEWPDTQKLSWGILLLFGGGIALAGQLEKAGIVHLLGTSIGNNVSAGIMLLFTITLVSIFISEMMSNVAQVIVFAPVIAGIAEAVQMNPLQLGLAMTLGASCAGMLPMGTPPNAIVFASGKLKLKHMLTAGLVMNILASVLIALVCWYLVPILITPIK
jgi:sodium-dependent dicarboxylate transporter 2/3/5